MADAGLVEIISREWLDCEMLVEFALDSECERDSEGSMLTRSALVLLYSMVDAELSVIAQSILHSGRHEFTQPEVLFLTETAVGVGTDGDITATESHQQFKSRILGVPRVLARRVVGRDASLDLGDKSGADLLRYKDMRDELMHPRVGADSPRVSKAELREAHAAVRAYFRQLATAIPELFGAFNVLLDT